MSGLCCIGLGKGLVEVCERMGRLGRLGCDWNAGCDCVWGGIGMMCVLGGEFWMWFCWVLCRGGMGSVASYG